MRLALVQFNPTVGDIGTNSRRIVQLCSDAAQQGADLVVLPELAITGYPPRDLLLLEGFVPRAMEAARDIARQVTRCVAVVGCPWLERVEGWRLTNSALVIRDGQIDNRYDKLLLPTYDVFDEGRYFVPGAEPLVIDVAGIPVGVTICEDLWRGADAWHEARYEGQADPVAALVAAGARLLINPSGSPFVIGKGARQRDIVRRHVAAHNIALATVNQVGGNDDLIFDGHAAVYVPTPGGPRLVAAGPGFKEQIVLCDLPADPASWDELEEVADPRIIAPRERLLAQALVLGVRDYCRKTGFAKVVMGLSGGIDSALTCAIAVAALGADSVLGVALPSRYSSEGSVDDAHALASALGVTLETVAIEEAHLAMESLLTAPFTRLAAGAVPGVTEENIQARLRGVILMAISNKTGALLLTTGNKSELAVGYCTLYGDMNGGLAVLSDVSKQDVYAVSRWINAHPNELGLTGPPIPESTLTKPPSAELRPNQTDQDSLPPYDMLDQIIERRIEQCQSVERIVDETGIDPATVNRIVRMIDINEYKRRQMPVGLKVTAITFGPGRRHPIAHAYRPQMPANP